MSSSIESDTVLQHTDDVNTSLLMAHGGDSASLPSGSDAAGQVEVSTRVLVIQLIEHLHELASINDPDTLNMFEPALEDAHEDINSMLTIAYNF